ncbi:hypothetical protein QYM36_001643 [Artemia franciscana]|uniref:Uncharacterized protein n=1 Tax=Artemia franciscana TaxID=6661 RepID=A0AA88LBI6_ARTSF|nr:hypothetical protein QYM36_001643 [Artemia franciscana]
MKMFATLLKTYPGLRRTVGLRAVMGARPWPSRNIQEISRTPLLEESIEDSYSSSVLEQGLQSESLSNSQAEETGVHPGRFYRHPPVGGGWPEGGGNKDKKHNHSKVS